MTHDKRFESKKSFRWIHRIDGIDSFLIKSVSRPVYRIVKTDSGDFTRVYEDIKVNMFDPIEPSGAEQVESIMQRLNGFVGDIDTKLIDSTGSIIETYRYTDARIVRIDMSPLDYTTDEACMITLNIRFETLEFSTSKERTE